MFAVPQVWSSVCHSLSGEHGPLFLMISFQGEYVLVINRVTGKIQGFFFLHISSPFLFCVCMCKCSTFIKIFLYLVCHFLHFIFSSKLANLTFFISNPEQKPHQCANGLAYGPRRVISRNHPGGAAGGSAGHFLRDRFPAYSRDDVRKWGMNVLFHFTDSHLCLQMWILFFSSMAPCFHQSVCVKWLFFIIVSGRTHDAPSSAKFPVRSDGGPARGYIYVTVVGDQATSKGFS